MKTTEPSIFLDDDFEEVDLTPQKVICLGKEFSNEDKRREYFRNELRKKLPELKQIEGYPIGEDEDIIALSDPPYYTACPNPWINDFIDLWEKEKCVPALKRKRKENFEIKEPYVADVSEGKYDPTYLFHSYLTKVPHKAIIHYLEHYTQPGDIVYDGFSGTGMLGVAARLCPTGERKAICSDLSTLASFICYSINNDISENKFYIKAKSIVDLAYKEYQWMFKTRHNDKINGTINYVLWSATYFCPHCNKEIIFWNDVVDIENGKIPDSFNCPQCGARLSKRDLIQSNPIEYDNIIDSNVAHIKYVPCKINYSVEGKRFEKIPDEDDIKLLNKIKELKINDWIPLDLIIKGDKTNEAIRHGYSHFYQLYTKRILSVISKIKNLIDEPIYHLLITKIAFQSTIMYRYTYMNGCWGAGGGPMSGTYYLPSLFKEINIFNQLYDIINLYKKIDIAKSKSQITSVQSATELSQVKENSIDYIFTDPPFGHNLMYSELNYITEMWLKVITNNLDECIENKQQRKDVYAYQSLMQESFRQYYRILKPGRWMSVEFSNTSAAVWNAIQNAIQNSGFIIVNVSALDKQKGSYNATNSTTAVKQDLVITCFKPSEDLTNKFAIDNNKSSNAMDFIEELLIHIPVHREKEDSTTAVIERNPKILYDRLISYYVQHGYAIPMDAHEFQKMLRERFIERDGMFFTASQAVEYEEKRRCTKGIVEATLFIGSESEGIEWLKRTLEDPQTYQELQPEWMRNLMPVKKGDKLPELSEILEENFIKDENGKWRNPNPEKSMDLEAIRARKLIKEFNIYLEQARKPKAKRMKDTRLEVLRYGFKECYKNKDFQSIVTVGDHIQESLLQEDEVLLQYYDIALSRL